MTNAVLVNLATLGPIGRLRPAPGTWGSAAGVITGIGILSIGPFLLEAAIIIVSLLGVVAANAYERVSGKKDASEVIIDEVAGQWIVLLVTPMEPLWIVAAFLVFRFLDITKIGPIGMAEKWPGGIGVMADDIIAGVIGAAGLWGLQLLIIPV
ncbi:phosphatidylglycerophosphatase A [Alphaproteobacteria bacterium]|nr:phosphatidylglycerophosphatase A [Alphaproteobacteria bacterium]